MANRTLEYRTSHRHGNLLNLILFPSSKTWHLWTTGITWSDSSNSQRWSQVRHLVTRLQKNQILTTKPQIHEHWSHVDTPCSTSNHHLEYFSGFWESLRLEPFSKWSFLEFQSSSKVHEKFITINHEEHIVSRIIVIWDDNIKIKDWKTFYGV